jgi:hypothetical protein
MPRCRKAWLFSAAGVGLLLVLTPLAAQQSKLAIVNAALLEAEGGFPAPGDAVYVPGETLYLAFNIQGFTRTRDEQIRLSYHIDARDFKGVRFLPPEEGRIETRLAPQDAKWMPRVRFSGSLPAFADSGTYKFAIRVVDELGKVEARQEVTFPVRGRNVPPSDTIVVRNFAFSRQEEGEPLPAPAFRPGDELWASFDITGYQIGERNRIGVEYNLAVLNEAGEVVYQQPEAAREEGTSFYPRRYVHAVFSLNLAGTERGQYTIALTIRDAISEQTEESRHTFTVE